MNFALFVFLIFLYNIKYTYCFEFSKGKINSIAGMDRDIIIDEKLEHEKLQKTAGNLRRYALIKKLSADNVSYFIKLHTIKSYPKFFKFNEIKQGNMLAGLDNEFINPVNYGEITENIHEIEED
jgi:hypothetical protein